MNKSTRDNEQRPPAGGKVLEMPAAVPRPGEVVPEILRSGAQALLAQALEAEIAAHLASVTCEDFPGERLLVCFNPLVAAELRGKGGAAAGDRGGGGPAGGALRGRQVRPNCCRGCT